ncbi:DUF7716 domain-containing protein [Gilliamella sp. wkB112]|uniref:DUF7716 domain-containing protein n=1 Tax=Gilliamella sp. wkB112 TaxID=3120257 RepID=UPI00080EA19D|nr:hypothetical protein [Gilliamella apicola]OCG01104.1 hypothetical protein A9G12_00670 [Gilliamella apicola]
MDSSDFPLDSNDFLAKQVKKNGWIETLDEVTIEDLVENAKEQLGKLLLTDLFRAFVFYYKNDAFLQF